MIKRTYFMVFRKNFNDGSGKYAENSFTITTSTLLAHPSMVFSEGREASERQLSEYPGDSVFCMAFNRL